MEEKLKAVFKMSHLHLIALMVLIYFVVFFKLGSFSFRLWDESMFAVNAYEMEKNGNYMVPYFDGEIDWRNSKPLLLTWIQVGFIKMFGFNELSMRLPGAIAVAASIIMLFQFLRKKIDTLFAWIAVMILLTSFGYISLHTGRTGDTDSILSFFLLGTSIYFLKWLLEEKNKYLLISLIFFSFAVMSKSFAAFLIVPPLFVFAVFYLKKQFLLIFKSSHFYIGLTFFLLSLSIIFYMREIYQPGYLKYTFFNDASRLGNVIELHKQGWDFYVLNLFNERFSYWTISFLLGVILCFQIENRASRTMGFFFITIVFIYLFLISISITKLYWYDMPIYPFLAAISAVPLYAAIKKFNTNKYQISMLLAMIFLFVLPYRKMFYLSQSNKFSLGDEIAESPSIFLYNQLKKSEADDLTIYHYGYKGSLLCYKYMYRDKGKELTIAYDSPFKSGEKVFVGNDSLKKCLNKMYTYDTLSTFQKGLFVQIKQTK